MKRAVLAAAVAALSFVGFAKTIDVPLGEDVAAAVASAEAGDVVQLAAGEYTLSATVTIAKGITVKGAGRSLTTVNGGKACQLFVLSNADAVLSDLTVTGGKAATGAGVKITAGTLQDAAVENCEATAGDNAGAGVWLEGTQSAVRRCEVKGCTTGGYGGGIYANGSTVVESCRVTGCSGSWGAGVYVDQGSSVRVVQSSVYGNTATKDVYNWNNNTARYLNCHLGSVQSNSGASDKSGSVINASATEADLVGKGVDLSGEAGLDGLDLNSHVFNFGSAEVLPSAGCVEYNPQCNIRTDELDVAGYPEDFGSVTPAYGLTNGLSAAEQFVCSAPSGEVDLGDGRFATCIGYNLYTNKLGTLDEWLPWTEGAETSFTYAHPAYARAKLVWNWSVKALIGMDRTLTLASSAFGSSVVAATVTSIGETASEATLTFHYGTASNALDGTVEVSVTDANVWRATIPHCIAGKTYYVKATLENDDGEVVISDVFDFVQPETIEPGDVSSESYQKNGLVGQWDGIDNVIVDGRRMHSDTPDKWYDLSGNGYDGTFASPTTLTWHENCWENATDGVKPVLLPVAHSARLANKVFTVEFLVEPSNDTDRFGYFSQWNGTKGFGLEQTAAGCVRVGYWSSLPITADYNPIDSVRHVLKDQKTAVTYTVSNAVHVLYVNGVKKWTTTGGNANLAIAGDVQFGIGGEPSTRTEMAFRGKWYSCRTYDRALSADEVAENYRIDRRRFVEGVRESQPLELQNGQLVTKIPLSASVQKVFFYAGATYGGVDGWGDPVAVSNVAAGVTSVSFPKPAGWGSSVWFARVRIGEGDDAAWSKTLIAEPPAPLGMSETLVCASSTFGSSDIAATVTGIGKTASEATLTFGYGTTPDCADGSVELSVTDAGEWRGTIPHLAAGTHCYVKATLSNDVAEVVASDVFDFVQPEFVEDRGFVDIRDMPEGYIQMERLAVTGKEWVQTDFLPTQTTAAEFSFGDVVNAGTEATIFGQAWSSSEYLFGILYSTPQFCFFGGGSKLSLVADECDYFLTIEPTSGGNGSLTLLNKTDPTRDSSATVSLATDQTAKLKLFGLSATGNLATDRMVTMTFYSLKFWKDGELAADYVPAYEVSSDTAGLCDLKGGRFYPSQATAFAPQPFVLNAELKPLNGRFEVKVVKAGFDQIVTLCWGETYGGTGVWEHDSSVTIPAGSTTKAFDFPDGWGSSVWFARVKVSAGDDVCWSKTLMAEPPAPLGVEKPTCLSSAFGSSEIAAQVTGIGLTASEATLTFGYGTTPDCADGSVELSVTDAGEWRGTIPHLAAGKTYYVKATLENVQGERAESDVLKFVQPEVGEDGVDPRLRPLPEGYVQMEKLTSKGSEYIVTDWKPDSTTASEAEIGEFVWKSDCALFGQEYSGSCYLMTVQGNIFKWYGPGERIYPTTTVDPSADYQIKLTPTSGGNGDVTILNRATEESASKNLSLKTSSGYFALFAANGGSNKATFSLYSFKAWKNGEISIDLVPAYEKSTETAGLYDLKGRKFYFSKDTAFERQTFVEDVVLTCQGDKLVMTVPESVAADTAVSLFAGETYGGVDGWGAAVETGTVAADKTTVEFDLPANWGSSVWFARAKIGEGDGARWSKTLVAADATLPSVSLDSLDGVGGDTMVVKGTVESLGGTSCTLTAYVGPDENSLTNVWANVDGSILTETGDFTLKLFEDDMTAPRYLVPGETNFVRVVATSANGKVAWSSVKSVTMASEAAFRSQSATVSGHTMTVTASMSDLGMTGATVVELWVGESASSLAKADSRVVTAGTSFTLTATLVEFEKDYFWQLKAVNTSEGGTSSTTVETETATKSTPDTATYTWTGAGTDNRWANRDNWSDNKSGDCLGYPQSVNATAVFNKNADVEIDLPRSGTTVNVGSLNLGTADIDVRFHSADTNSFGLVLNGLTVPGKNARWTLDHAFVYRAAEQTWSAGTALVLTNAANLYINNCTMSGGDVSIRLLDESRMSVNTLYTGGGSTVVVSDSTFETRGNEYLCNAAGESTIRFEGAHPKWRHYRTGNDGLCYVSKDNAANRAHFDFLVPVDGYESVPFETVNVVPNYYMGSASGLSESPNRHITINVLPESPAARVNKEITTPLVFWGRGIGANVVTDTLPNETGEDEFVWSDKYKGTDTEKFCLLSATIVGSTHTDRLTVTGVPEELVGSSISPGYGNQDGQTSRTLTAPAEPTTYDNGTRRATCLGWKLYDVDPATQTAGATPVESGTENTYAWTSENKWQKFVWQWKREVSVSATAGTGGSVDPAAGWAAETEAYTVTATPESGYRFYKWTGDVPQQKMFNATLSDIFRKPSALSAVFVSDGELTEAAAAQSGDWSAAETWGGAVPGAGSKVVIAGKTVSVSAADALLVGAIEVKDGGVLRIWGADADATKPDPKTVVPLTGIAAGSDLLLDVVGDFTVDGSSWVSVGGRNADYRVFVNVGGNLALGESAKFAVYGGAVEPDADDVEKYMGDGAAVNVGSNLTTAAGAWVYPFAHGVKGSNVRFSVGGDVEIAAGGGFDADGKGYQNPNGPGYFYYGGNGDGGSYGGVGGTGAGEGGKTRSYGFEYGYAFAPFMVGSSGNPGGSGGGAIRLHVAGDVTLEGSLKASGMVTGDTAVMANKSGCGSGGSVWVTCAGFHPVAGAEISAMGASGNTTDSGGPTGNWRGGGGGGRVAIVTGGVGDALLDELYATGTCKDLVVMTTDVNNPAECDYPTLINIRGGWAVRLVCYGTAGTGAIMVNPGDSSILKVTVEPDFNVFEDLALYPVPGSSTLEGTLTATSSTPAFVAGTDRRERRLLTAYDYANAEGTIRTGSTPECELDPADGGSLFLTWKFAQLEKLLRIAYDPTRGSIANLDNGGWYVDGTTATVTAVPAEGWRFLAWTGEVEVEHSGDNPLSLAMDVPHDVEAVFVPSATAETLSATQGGEWFDAATWGGAAVPDENTDVVIDAKTVYLPSVVNVQAKSITVKNGGKLRLWGVGNDLLKITPMVTTCEGTLTATIGGDVTVEGNGSWISVGGLSSGYRVDLTIGGNLTLGANGKFAVYGGAVEPDAKDVEKYMGDGAKVTVVSNLTTAAGAWVYPFAHGVKGSNVRFTVGGDVEIAAGGGFDATGRGYLNPNGPGYFYYGGNGDGGSYGGVGGTGAGEGGKTRTYGFAYGYAKAPFMSGSAGNVAAGGGTIRIHAQGDFTLAGKLLALPTKPGNPSGAGGGVWITCKNFTPVEGASIEANGLDNNWGWAGAGGGGRVAILTGGCDDGMLAEFYATGESTNENLRVVTTNVNDSAECSYPWLINVRGGKNTGDYQATNPLKPFTNGGDGTGVILLNLGNSRPITVSVEPAAGTMEGLVVSPSVGLTTIEGEVTATVTATNFVTGTDQRERRILTGHVYANENETLHAGSEASCAVNSADGNDLALAWTFGRLEKLIRVTADANCGTVTGIENGGWYLDGTTATVTAHPAEGWRFLAWTGDVPKRCATENPISLAMDVPRGVKAVFVQEESPAALTATKSGDWFEAETWGGAGVPGADTAVTIESNKNLTVEVTLPMDVSVKSITLAGQGMLRLWGVDATATPNPTTVNPLGAEKVDPSFTGELKLTVAESITIGGKAWMSVGGKGSNYRPQVAVGRDLALDGTAAGFSVYAGPVSTNDLVTYAKGSCRVNVGRSITLADKSIVYPFNHPTNGAAVVFSAQNVTVGTNAAFKAEKAGYEYCYGPGAYRGVVSGWIEGYGASYGGINARYSSTYPLQPTYGNAYAPFWSGSCGVANGSSGVPGGGAIILNVARQLTLYGWLDANALPFPSGKGSGSGGSVWVCAKRIKIDAGSAKITAEGGSPTYGGSGSSGGGRICMVERVPSETQFAEVVNLGDRDDFPLLRGFDVLCTNLTDAATLAAAGFDEAYTNVFSAADGTHNNMTFYSESTPGTAVWLRAKPAGTVIIVR